MNFQLRIATKSFLEDGSGKRVFTFAVLDLDKSKSYPQNFVCILPKRVTPEGKTQNTFYRIFGEKSVAEAKNLLINALKRENDSEVRAEIERRLELLEPKKEMVVKCSLCGQMFHPVLARKFKRPFCPECLNKKYALQRREF